MLNLLNLKATDICLLQKHDSIRCSLLCERVTPVLCSDVASLTVVIVLFVFYIVNIFDDNINDDWKIITQHIAVLFSCVWC